MSNLKAYRVSINGVMINTKYIVESLEDVLYKIGVVQYTKIDVYGSCGKKHIKCRKNKFGYYTCGDTFKCSKIHRYKTEKGIVNITSDL